MKVWLGLLTAALLIGVFLLVTDPPDRDQDSSAIRWATSASGSAGHRSMLALSGLLNRHWQGHRIDVLPTAGAVASLRGYGTGLYDGFYGADISFHEVARDSGRLRGYSDASQRPILQTLWVYSMEVGLAVPANRAEQHPDWQSFQDQTLFTGPAAWDVRAQLDRTLSGLDIGYRYREVDLGLAASNLARGSLDGMIVYTAGERQPPAWLQEAQMATELHVVNPSEAERSALQAAGVNLVELPASLFRAGSEQRSIWLSPFLYGFHLGPEVSAEAVYQMLSLIEQHASALAQSDPVFNQLAEDMVGLQRRGIESTGSSGAIHPGLARFLKQRNAWEPAWDERIAEQP